MAPSATETEHFVDAAMQFDDIGAAGALMQPIDVLRDETLDAARCAELHECAMRGIRVGSREHRPTDHAACPVTAPRMLGIAKGLPLNGLRTHPITLEVPIAGDARRDAHASPGQHEQPLVPLDKLTERVERGGARRGPGRRKLGQSNRSGRFGHVSGNSFNANGERQATCWLQRRAFYADRGARVAGIRACIGPCFFV